MVDFSNLNGKEIRFNKEGKRDQEGLVLGSYSEIKGWFFSFVGGLHTEHKLLVKTPTGKIERIDIQDLTYVK